MSLILTQEIIKKKSAGKNLESIRRLNLWGMKLNDISILSNCPNIEILSLSYNSISDISALRSCTNLKELYLIKNKITDMDQLANLKGIQDLRIFCIDQNPICDQYSNLRVKILKLLPQLYRINNENVTGDDRESSLFENINFSAENHSHFKQNNGSLLINETSKSTEINLHDTSLDNKEISKKSEDENFGYTNEKMNSINFSDSKGESLNNESSNKEVNFVCLDD